MAGNSSATNVEPILISVRKFLRMAALDSTDPAYPFASAPPNSRIPSFNEHTWNRQLALALEKLRVHVYKQLRLRPHPSLCK
jgi:hypothetical protein